MVGSRESCIVPGCLNRHGHKFPRKRALRQKWIEAIQFVDGAFTKSPILNCCSFVCSEHFSDSDFISQIGLGGEKVKKLRKNSVPSKFPWTINETPSFDASKVTKSYSRCGSSGGKMTARAKLQSRGEAQSEPSEQYGAKMAARDKVQSRGETQLKSGKCEAADHSIREYLCKICEQSIIGFRYACVQCSDWDLCGACEARGEHATHYVLRVPPHKTLKETREVLAALRQMLACVAPRDPIHTGDTCADTPDTCADTAPFKQEFKTEDPLAAEVFLEVPVEYVGDKCEVQEDYVDTDSTDDTDYILPTAPQKRKVAQYKKSAHIKTVSPMKLKRITDGAESITVVQKECFHLVPNTPPIMVPNKAVPTGPPVVAPNIAIRRVSLKNLKVVTARTSRSLFPTIIQKGSSQILPITPPLQRIAPKPPNLKILNTPKSVRKRKSQKSASQKIETDIVIKKVSPEDLKRITEGAKKNIASTSTAVQKEHSHSNTDESTFLDEDVDKIERLTETSCLQDVKKETIEVSSSDDAISNTGEGMSLDEDQRTKKLRKDNSVHF